MDNPDYHLSWVSQEANVSITVWFGFCNLSLECPKEIWYSKYVYGQNQVLIETNLLITHTASINRVFAVINYH